MDKYKQAFRVAEAIKRITSDEMIEFLKNKNAYDIYDLAMRHVKATGELENFLIASFPRRIHQLTSN